MGQFTNAANTDWVTSLWAVSQDQFLQKLTDNIFNKSAIFQLMKERSNVIIKAGGPQIQVPMMVSANTGIDSISGYDVVDTSPQSGFIDGNITKAEYAGPITISFKEEEENSGPSKIIDLLAGRTQQTQRSLEDRINTDLYLDGTGNGGKNLTGFKLMMPIVSAPGTYMGINGATVTAWTHKIGECASGTIVESGLDGLYYKISDGSDRPDMVVVDDLGMKLYESQNRATGVGISYMNATLADSGFKTAAYKGMPMILDQGQTSNTFFLLSSKYLGFYYKPSTTDFVRPANQVARVALVHAFCQLVTDNRRRQGRLIATA